MPFSDQVHSHFVTTYGEEPLLVRSPGRVNLIGEHTDYNMGFVLPAAIDRTITFAMAARNDNVVELTALNLNEQFNCTLDEIQKTPRGWPNYILGVVEQFQKADCAFRGFNCVFGGDIPIGAGLSSSAAVETGFAFALNEIFQFGVDPLMLAQFAQKAENEFVGVQCGIMDQFINVFGAEHTALRIDCRSLEYVPVPFPEGADIVLFDTRVSHSHAASGYNKRRAECEKGVRKIAKRFPQVASLRDVTPEILKGSKKSLDATTYKRCAFIVHENERVLAACEELKKNDLSAFGQLLYASHEGLSKKYEVSCPELDALVKFVKSEPGVFGARMMGGGFGGCTINLIRPEAVLTVCKNVEQMYKKKFKTSPAVYVTSIGGGTKVITAQG